MTASLIAFAYIALAPSACLFLCYGLAQAWLWLRRRPKKEAAS